MNKSGTFSYEIIQSFGVLSTSPAGWTTELNLVSWGGRNPKYDIRAWSPDHQKMSKGVSLAEDEMVELRAILQDMTLEEQS